MKVVNQTGRSRRSPSGQGITEYFAVMAFAATVIAMVFALPASPLYNSVGNAFHSIANQLTGLVARA